jgi:hypothetical protein
MVEVGIRQGKPLLDEEELRWTLRSELVVIGGDGVWSTFRAAGRITNAPLYFLLRSL